MTSEAEKLDDVEFFVYPDEQCVVFDMAFHAALVFSYESMRAVFLRC